MRALLATLLALLAFAPLAMAVDNDTTDASDRPDDAAWVEDCPPDMMCAYGSEDCIECTRGPADGSCENCRGDNVTDGTCMDGADAGEACDPDVQYLDGRAGPPESDPRANDTVREVPGAGFALVVAGLALAIFLVARAS